MNRPRVLLLGDGRGLHAALRRVFAPRADVICGGTSSVADVHIDLRDWSSIARGLTTAAPDLVLNASECPGTSLDPRHVRQAYAVNTDGVRVLGELLWPRSVPLIHFSSHDVFDGLGERPYRESDPAAPATIFGVTKRAGEEALLDLGLPQLTLRTSWLLDSTADGRLARLRERVLEGDVVHVPDDMRGSPVYVGHVATAALRIAEMLFRAPEGAWVEASRLQGIYHLAGLGHTTWFGLATALSSRLGAGAWIEPCATPPPPAGRAVPLNATLDGLRAAALLGIAMPHWIHALDACLEADGLVPRARTAA